jgi:hypothetical protein
MSRSQTKSNVTVRGVFPRTATFFLSKSRRRGRRSVVVVSDGEWLRLLRRGERKSSGGWCHEVGGVGGGGIRADHGSVCWSVRCGSHHDG